ncbi:MAG: GntR family transcriptional regulator [Deltaproteobacteria bacterium]|nr:GntR family transcriptional regulator [Deltaproteobacteria bacterium]
MALNDLASVSHSTLEKTVYNELLRAIISGKLSPGTQITITELAEQLGVSLMPVRQALRALEAKNLVSIMKNRRLSVRRLSVDDLNELLRIRINLECMAAEKAAENPSLETIQTLERLLDEMVVTGDREVYLNKNREFHHTIYRSANMPILLEIIEDLWSRTSPYYFTYLVAGDVGEHRVYHEGMLRGMGQRDGREVCKWLAMDLEKAAQELTKQLVARC